MLSNSQSSESCCRHRDKIPIFKPKTIDEIFSEPKCLKKNSQTIITLLHSQQLLKAKSKRRLSQLIQQETIEQKMQENVQQMKIPMKSFEQLLLTTGRKGDIQSQQYKTQKSQDSPVLKLPMKGLISLPLSSYHSQSSCSYQPLTPQSNVNIFLLNPFKCKDDNNFSMFTSNWANHQEQWNGKIQYADSVTYEQESEQSNDADDLDNKIQQFMLKPYLDKKSFYVELRRNQNQILLDSKQPFKPQLILTTIKQFQLKSNYELALSKQKWHIKLTQLSINNSEFVKLCSEMKQLEEMLKNSHYTKFMYKIVHN